MYIGSIWCKKNLLKWSSKYLSTSQLHSLYGIFKVGINRTSHYPNLFSSITFLWWCTKRYYMLPTFMVFNIVVYCPGHWYTLIFLQSVYISIMLLLFFLLVMMLYKAYRSICFRKRYILVFRFYVKKFFTVYLMLNVFFVKLIQNRIQHILFISFYLYKRMDGCVFYTNHYHPIFNPLIYFMQQSLARYTTTDRYNIKIWWIWNRFLEWITLE